MVTIRYVVTDGSRAPGAVSRRGRPERQPAETKDRGKHDERDEHEVHLPCGEIDAKSRALHRIRDRGTQAMFGEVS